MLIHAFKEGLTRFAEELTASFSTHIPAQPEDQLKAPVLALLRATGTVFRLRVGAVTETRVEGLGGRPDVGVAVKRLLTGHIELKAPGKGARPGRYTGGDLEQWRKFKALPNVIYTDGSEWALFRSGEQQGKTITLGGDATRDGADAFSEENADQLQELLRDFLLWEPITPSSPKALAELLAPLCRLVRDDVAAAVKQPDSNLTQLAQEWRQALFPDADDAQFADAYAQTLTYAMLLARFSGQDDVAPSRAADALDSGHGLLAQALRILGQNEAREEIGLGVDLLVRVIGAVDGAALRRKGSDPWLYFYEDFLSAYDPKLRNDRGVYYTPPEVIQAQVRLVAELLQTRFGKELGFASPGVVVLDPSAGTGAYPLAALQHGLEQVVARFGEGSVSGYASDMARNLHAFEILVGPYAVAHLQLTQAIQEAGGQFPDDGIHVYLTDTLESPHAQPPGQQTLLYRRLAREHERAQKVKAEVPVLVCIGNPPYDRQEISAGEEGVQRKGGWVRYGEDGKGGILEAFLAPAREAGQGVHIKNLYNDYVYFWRWALWKVFESEAAAGPGIVCLITAASYLRGPGFVGMRRVMRETFDELWIIDLEGDNLGARKTENVFSIRTPVAIALGVRYGRRSRKGAATVHYARITGTRADKRAALAAVRSSADLRWSRCFSGWHAPFLPEGSGEYFAWPLLTDVFPWQYSGVQLKRTWPIGETKEVLRRRWETLVSVPKGERGALFREAGRTVNGSYLPVSGGSKRLTAIADEPANAAAPPVVRYAFRSFDRQWVIKDPRLADRMRPPLWLTHGRRQIHMTTLLTKVLGLGAAACVASEVPDLDHFCGRGGKDVIPLWRDAGAAEPNMTGGLLQRLTEVYGCEVEAEDLFAYCYALLGGPGYVGRFSEELTIPGPRMPITKSADLFREVAEAGRKLVHLHTYGQRFAPEAEARGGVRQGQARNTHAVPSDEARYPERFGYDEPTGTLHVGEGTFGPVAPEVWRFSVSGFEVLRSWLSYRMKKGAGRTSSELDAIRPTRWTAAMNTELLELLWVLEATVAAYPELEALLERVVSGPAFTAKELPQPTAEERQAPRQEKTGPASRSSLPGMEEEGEAEE